MLFGKRKNKASSLPKTEPQETAEGVVAETAAEELSYDGGITVKEANLHYGDFHALKNISIEIPEHRITAFIGPSGCGKSTFLKCFNRMNDLVAGCKVEGEFTIGNVNIYGNIDVNELRKNVGMVFQKPNPFPMSVYDNIVYGPRTFGIKKRAALDEIVEAVAETGGDVG